MGIRLLSLVLLPTLTLVACKKSEMSLMCDTLEPTVGEEFGCEAIVLEKDCSLGEYDWTWTGSPDSLQVVWGPIGPFPFADEAPYREFSGLQMVFAQPDEGQLQVELRVDCSWLATYNYLIDQADLSATDPADDDDTAPDDDDAAEQPPMGFFVTSQPIPDGAIGGLAGADAFCQQRIDAAPVDDAVKARPWRAYLGTTPIVDVCAGDPDPAEASIDPRDRIGEGPWLDFSGAEVASDLEHLHKAGLDPAHALTELGTTLDAELPLVATGADFDGLVSGQALQDAINFDFGAGNCCNWTLDNQFASASAGHWTSPAADWNHGYTVSCDGFTGAGGDTGYHLYCFAAD